MLLKSWGAALALSLAFMSGVVQAQVVLPGGVTTPGGQPVGVVPMAIINPNDGATCIVGNTGCPSIGGGGSVISNYALENGGNLQALAATSAATLAAMSNPAAIMGANGSTIVSGANPFNVQGGAASGSTDSDVPLNNGGRAATTVPTAVTDGQKVAQMFTPEGKVVQVPYAPDALRLRGSASTTGSSPTQLIAAQGASVKIYIAAVQCFRTDTATTALYVTLNDSASTTVPVPPVTTGAAIPFPVPLDVAANTAFTFTPSAGVTTVFCNAQGYKGN